jgi:hypothetical protein
MSKQSRWSRWRMRGEGPGYPEAARRLMGILEKGKARLGPVYG